MVQATFKISAVLDRPIEDVWVFVSDVTNQDHWVAGMSGSAVVGVGADDGPAAPRDGADREPDAARGSDRFARRA